MQESERGRSSDPDAEQEPTSTRADPRTELREDPGEGGEAGAAQCLSVAPQRGLETRHNGCTVSRPSPALS